jgi:hypothetical protein
MDAQLTRLRELKSSGLPAQRAIALTLGAMEAAIAEQGVMLFTSTTEGTTEYSTSRAIAYFGCAMSLLTSSQGAQESMVIPEDSPLIAATYILASLFPHLPGTWVLCFALPWRNAMHCAMRTGPKGIVAQALIKNNSHQCITTHHQTPPPTTTTTI